MGSFCGIILQNRTLMSFKEIEMRELSYKALMKMEEDSKVIVYDITNDTYHQECTLHFLRRFVTTGRRGKNIIEEVISGIKLENEEYIFKYDWLGRCEDGEFKVYSKGE